MSSYSPRRRLKQQVVLGLTPRLWEFQFVRISEPWKPAERNSQRGQLPEPRLLTVPSCTFQSGKQKREPEGSSQGLNSWRERELESTATPPAEPRGVPHPGETSGQESLAASCTPHRERSATDLPALPCSLLLPPDALPRRGHSPHSSKVVSRLLPSLKLTKPDFYSQTLATSRKSALKFYPAR